MTTQNPINTAAKNCPECASKLRNTIKVNPETQEKEIVYFCAECDCVVSFIGDDVEVKHATESQKAIPEPAANSLEMLRRKLYADTFESLDAAPNPQTLAYATIVECETLILEYATKLGEAKVKHAAASKYLYVDDQQRTEVKNRIESREYELTHGRQRTQVEIDEAKRKKTSNTTDSIRKHVVDILRLVKASGIKTSPAPEKVFSLLQASKKYAPAMLTVTLVDTLIKDITGKGGK